MTRPLRTSTKPLSLDEAYGEAYTRRGMAKMTSPKFDLSKACSDFELGEEHNDALATEYIKKYCR